MVATVAVGKHSCVTTLVSFAIEDDFILGLDLMEIFGIGITNLPILFPDDERLTVERMEVSTLEGVELIDTVELEQLLGALSMELEANASIPDGSYNSHPDGEFFVEFQQPHCKPIYVAQYRTSKTVEPLIARLKPGLKK